MIYLKKKDLTRCLGLSPAMDTAIRYIQTADLDAFGPGRVEVDGERVYFNRFDYQTVPPEQAAWEGHSRYADIHLLLSGRERIGVSNAASLRQTVSRPEEDFLGYEGPVELWFPMTTEDVLIVYPEDVHMVRVQADAPAAVRKVCFKVRL